LGDTPMTNRANDPVFVFFPDHYRWSMGLFDVPF
jgi:hypothetical protein